MPEYDIIKPFEVAQMIETTNELRFKALIAILSLTGHRVSEVLMLRKEDIYGDDEWTYFTFHVLKRRQTFIHTIKMPSKLEYIDIILQWRDECTDEKLFDFTRQYAHYIIKQSNSSIHPHMFRHTLATKLAERGANKYELDAWFGWSDKGNTSGTYVSKGTALIENIAKRML